MTVHALKTWALAFQAIWDRRKLFEIRPDDRGFAVGDLLVLREYILEDDRRTGREIVALVTHRESGTWGLPDNLVVLGIDVMARLGGRVLKGCMRKEHYE